MRVRFFSGLTLALAMGAGPAPARASFELRFDEFGTGFINQDNTGFAPFNGTLLPDPTQAGRPKVLTFLLPEAVGSGDVRIFDDKIGGTIGDILRFTDAAGVLNGNMTGAGTRMIFYSDPAEPGEPAGVKADTGFPRILAPNDLGGILEVGPQANNSFRWVGEAPLAGGPANVYFGVSDGVIPEPTSSVLLVGGGAALIALRRPTRRGGGAQAGAAAR